MTKMWVNDEWHGILQRFELLSSFPCTMTSSEPNKICWNVGATTLKYTFLILSHTYTTIQFIYILTATIKYVRTTQTTPKSHSSRSHKAAKLDLAAPNSVVEQEQKYLTPLSQTDRHKRNGEQQVPTPFQIQQFWQRKYICTSVCTVDCATGRVRATSAKHVTFWLKAYRNLDK